MSKTIDKRKAKSATVTIRRAEYERLLAKAGETHPDDGAGPPLPKPDANGNFPAVAFMRASIAREVVRRRHCAQLSQVLLARLAGTSQKTISDIETARTTPGEKIMQAIERVLRTRETAQARKMATRHPKPPKAA